MQVIKPNSIGLTDGSLTRATTATFVDSTGTIVTGAINFPRVQYDPSTLVFQGLLLEQAATNLAANSASFDNATWAKTNTVVTANTTVSPDGTTSGDKVDETAVNGTHDITTNAVTVTAGIVYSWSVFVKAAQRTSVRLQAQTAFFTVTSADFDLTAGTTSGAINCTSKITKYNNGWYKISITATCTTSGSAAFLLTLLNGGSGSYLGVVGNGVVAWGAQVETGSVVTSYIPTFTGNAARAADVINGTNLIFTNATDPNAVWSSATTYTIGQRVRYLNIVYESLQNSNLNKIPTSNPTFWLSLGNDNMHAALDTSSSSLTSATTELTYIVKVDNPAALAFINVEASVIEISCTDQTTGVIFYSSVLGLTGSNVQDWNQYFFFDPLVKRTQIVISDLGAAYLNVIVTIRLKTSIGELASLSTFIAGPVTKLGQLQSSPTVGIIDYSKKETDAFGNFTFVQRAFSKRLSAEIFLDNTLLNGVQRFLTSLRATPALWIGSDDPTYEETLIVYGFYRDFSTTIAYPQVSLCSLEIEGLT